MHKMKPTLCDDDTDLAYVVNFTCLYVVHVLACILSLL